MFKKTYVIPTVLALVLGLSSALPAYAESGHKNKDAKKDVRIEKSLKTSLPGLEVQIGANGNVLVRGAKVTSVSGSNIVATTGWGSSVITWNVVTDSSTNIIHRGGDRTPMSNIKVGDTISFQGSLNTNASAFTVNAKTVKDWSSDVPVRTTLEGKAKTAIASTTLPSSFVLASGGTDYTVKISSLTSVLNSLWLRMSPSLIKVGDTIRVYGAVNSDATVDATVVRNTSVR